jgi:outer membrane protein OmpA-like peptidoglycan-associated protein
MIGGIPFEKSLLGKAYAGAHLRIQRAFVIAVLVGAAGSLSVAAASLVGNGQQSPGATQTEPINEPRNAPGKPSGLPVSKGAAAIEQHSAKCSLTLTVSADALFGIDRWTLNPDAGQTLDVLGPMIANAGKHPVHIEAFTDSTTADDYAHMLTEKRAITVRGWLVNHGFLPEATTIDGLGKHNPLVSNPKPDGADDPLGRQRNRRMEVVIDTCK